MGKGSDALERRSDPRAVGRVRERARPGVKDDLIGVAGLGGEPALEQVHRGLGARAGEREVAGVLLPDRA
jgi:hypothetical protein